jgi:hypothetical protein
MVLLRIYSEVPTTRRLHHLTRSADYTIAQDLLAAGRVTERADQPHVAQSLKAG